MTDDKSDGRPEWAQTIEDARNATGPGLVALCRLLALTDDTPPCLRELSLRYVSLARETPPARASDPSTSKAAGERARASRGPKVRKILGALARLDNPAASPYGLTARELVDVAKIPGAWKRVSELKTEGLIEPVPRRVHDAAAGSPSMRPLTRAGGVVFRITPAGRHVLDKLRSGVSSRA